MLLLADNMYNLLRVCPARQDQGMLWNGMERKRNPLWNMEWFNLSMEWNGRFYVWNGMNLPFFHTCSIPVCFAVTFAYQHLLGGS